MTTVRHTLAPIIAESGAMRHAVATLRRYATTSLHVLLVGATGTGKELLASHLHHWSRRRGELVDVDCGALPRDMVEGLLFGCRRGAYTGATEDRAGLIELADGGTLLLDELAGLPEEGQRKLLRVLETAEVRRLGETHKRSVNLRVVATLQDDVGHRLAVGSLRRDLYERVAGVVVRLVPLAERPEDIVPLARHFAAAQGRTLESGAAGVLERHSWPGNVRELRKVIERAGPLVENGTLSAWALSESIEMGALSLPSHAPRASRKTMSRDELLAVGAANDWQPRRMAAACRVGRTTLFGLLKRSGLSIRAQRTSFQSGGPFANSCSRRFGPPIT